MHIKSFRISKYRDMLARTLMYDAAVVLMMRVKRASGLKEWTKAIARHQELERRARACPETLCDHAWPLELGRAIPLVRAAGGRVTSPSPSFIRGIASDVMIVDGARVQAAGQEGLGPHREQAS